MWRRADLVCVLFIVVAACVVHGHGVFRGRVLLPADVVLLMRPWSATARERFPDFRFTQNQMLGPIFEYYSWRYQVRERLRQGEIPLWNPLEMSGNVLLANSQSAVLYPPNLLLYVLPLWVGINLVTLLHSIATGLLMYGYLRSLKLLPPAALTGALAWMLCGPMLVWTEFQTPTAVLCWLPGALWAIDATAHTRKVVRGAMLAAVFVALSLTAGHPQFAFYVVMMTALYGLWRLKRAGLWFVPGVLVLGFCLAGATILPVAEASRINHRAGSATFKESVRLRLPPEYLSGLLLPNVLGNPRDYVRVVDGVPQSGNPYIGQYDFIEYCHYAGIATLVLTLLGLIRCFGHSVVRVWTFLGLLGMALALGTPLGAVLFYGVPGYSQFYAPARAVCVLVFALCVLAAFGCHLMLTVVPAARAHVQARATSSDNAANRAADRDPLVLFGLIGAACALGAVLVWPLMGLKYPAILSPDWITYEATNIRHAVLFTALVVLAAVLVRRNPETARQTPLALLVPVACAADLLVWGAGFNPATEPAMLAEVSAVGARLRATPPARVLSLEDPSLGIKSLIVPNYNAVVGYREVQGADSVHSRRYHRAMAEVARQITPGWRGFPDNNTIRLPGPDHPLLDALNVTHITTCPPATLDEARFPRDSDEELTVWRNPRALGAGWLVSQTERVNSPEDAVRTLSRDGFSIREMAVLEAPEPELDRSATGTVEMTRWSAHRQDYEVQATGSLLLVTSEPAYPGWRCFIESGGRVREQDILVANGVLRAVVVPAGSSRVAFKYTPSAFVIGLYLSGLAVAIVAGIAVAECACFRRVKSL